MQTYANESFNSLKLLFLCLETPHLTVQGFHHTHTHTRTHNWSICKQEKYTKRTILFIVYYIKGKYFKSFTITTRLLS